MSFLRNSIQIKAKTEQNRGSSLFIETTMKLIIIHLIADVLNGSKRTTSCRRPRNKLNPDVDILVGERTTLSTRSSSDSELKKQPFHNKRSLMFLFFNDFAYRLKKLIIFLFYFYLILYFNYFC